MNVKIAIKTEIKTDTRFAYAINNFNFLQNL